MILKKPFVEKRGHPRLDNNVPLKICHEDGDLVISEQFIGITQLVISGIGVVADDYSKINWEYTVNSGIVVESVEAIYY